MSKRFKGKIHRWSANQVQKTLRICIPVTKLCRELGIAYGRGLREEDVRLLLRYVALKRATWKTMSRIARRTYLNAMLRVLKEQHAREVAQSEARRRKTPKSFLP